MLFIVLGLSFVIHYYQFVLQAPWKVFSWSKMLQCEYWQELERKSVFLPGWFNMSIHAKLTLRKRAKWDVIYLCGDDVLLKQSFVCRPWALLPLFCLCLLSLFLPLTQTWWWWHPSMTCMAGSLAAWWRGRGWCAASWPAHIACSTSLAGPRSAAPVSQSVLLPSHITFLTLALFLLRSINGSMWNILIYSLPVSWTGWLRD